MTYPKRHTSAARHAVPRCTWTYVAHPQNPIRAGFGRFRPVGRSDVCHAVNDRCSRWDSSHLPLANHWQTVDRRHPSPDRMYLVTFTFVLGAGQSTEVPGLWWDTLLEAFRGFVVFGVSFLCVCVCVWCVWSLCSHVTLHYSRIKCNTRSESHN